MTDPDTPQTQPLRHWVEQSVERYFFDLEGQEANGVYDMVLKEVHVGLLRCVMQLTEGNQSKAASWLGLARGTLRKLLKEHAIVCPETKK